MRINQLLIASLFVVLVVFASVYGGSADARSTPVRIGERPALEAHTSQADIENGVLPFSEILKIGEEIFVARWNKLDGQGRPAATGNDRPTTRLADSAPAFIRTSGPDASACVDCHNQPGVGGAGGFVANVFVEAQKLDPVTDSVSADFSNERNSLAMNGSGAIEMLAREMTTDLLAIQTEAIASRVSGRPVTRTLETKGVNFGQIIALPDGTVDTSLVVGVDEDLIVRPFSQKAVVTSVRVFSINAFNQHHGMQAVERFGRREIDARSMTIPTDDFDKDGVADELSVGDITAVTLFQVAMNMPGRVIPDDKERRDAADRGELLFDAIGCTECHIPALILNSTVYTEPNPYNDPGNLRPRDVSQPYAFDLAKDIPSPRLSPTASGGAVVAAYTDLKRHVICDESDPFFCNERVIQDRVARQDVGLDEFITRKLWDVGNSAPYGHRGDLTTITEAILHHAGEAKSQRDSFAALEADRQAEIIEFLKQLQVLPNGAPPVVGESRLQAMLDGQKSVSIWDFLNPFRQ